MNTLPKNSERRWPGSRYTPFDRFFRNDLLDFWNDREPNTIPSINITEDDKSFKVEMAAPGMKKEDFNIDVDGNLVTISCEKESTTKSKDDNGKDNGHYSSREYNYSSFSRSFSVPDYADTAKIAAKYTDGILNLTIPKKPEPQKTRNKIPVE